MRKASIASLMLFLSSVAVATDFNYSYLQVDTYEAKDNERDIESTGIGADISYQSENGAIFHVAFDKAEIDKLRGFSVNGNDINSFEVSVGGASQYSDKLGFWTAIGLRYEEVDTSWTVNNYIYSMSFGARYWLVPRVELNATLIGEYQDYHESDIWRSRSYEKGKETDIGAELGLRIYPLKRLSIGGNASGLYSGHTQRFDIDLRWEL